MKAALIANGGIANAHRAAYRALKEKGFDLTLQAICDIRPERLAEDVTDGANVYNSIDDLLANEKDIDYVDICLPTFLHADTAIRCMEAGYHVLSEKPMALQPEDTQRMLECSKRTGKRLMIAQCCRFSDELQRIRQFVLEGSFGKPQSAFFTAVDGAPLWGWDKWFQDGARSGGCMLDLQAHNIDLIQWMFGMPKAISTVAVERGDFTGFGTISANMIYDEGLFVHSWCDWFVENNKHQNRTIRVNFEHGYLYNNRGANHELVAVDENGNVTDLLDPNFSKDPTYQTEIEYFATCLRENVPFRICPPEESAKVITIMRAQEQSAKQNGTPVYLD